MRRDTLTEDSRDVLLSLAEVAKIYSDNEIDGPVWELYERARNQTDLLEMYRIAYDYECNHDWSFGKASHRVMFPLYMACYAARKITGENQ